MKFQSAVCFLIPLILVSNPLTCAGQSRNPNNINFDLDIRPILSEHCFACHGFDEAKRQAGLRLDTLEGMRAKLPSGNYAILPSHLQNSTLIKRISTSGTSQMPPESFGKPLSSAQKDLLATWLKQGAKYSKHWSFETPNRPEVPSVAGSKTINPIDAFLLKAMKEHGLKPSKTATHSTLIRRATFDLTGLPPTPEQRTAFLNDTSPGAYDRLIDNLLKSPAYGERMTQQWLDIARYADTHGFHIDSHRDMWRWRDWVISAFNSNMPYDQFITEQLAGDLISNPTMDQRIATGFNRNHPINFEGGAIPEEYAAAYIFDRIDTTATAILGLTFRCAQCHDHKYDPLTMKDYYRFYAYFNNVPEQGLDGQKGNAVPYLKAPTVEQADRLMELKQDQSKIETLLSKRREALKPRADEWIRTANFSDLNNSPVKTGLANYFPLNGSEVDTVNANNGKWTGNANYVEGKFGRSADFKGQSSIAIDTSYQFDRNQKVSYGAWVRITSNDSLTIISKIDSSNDFRGWDLFIQNGKVFVHIVNKFPTNCIRINTRSPIELNKWRHVMVTYDGSSRAAGLHIFIDGKLADSETTYDSLSDTILTTKPTVIGKRTEGAYFQGQIQDVKIFNRYLSSQEIANMVEIDNLREILSIPANNRKPEQALILSEYYFTHNDQEYAESKKMLESRTREYKEIEASIPTTMVMQELDKPRDTFMLIRGQYDKRGDKVGAAIPAIFSSSNADLPPNRLGLAKWIIDDKNPLTARVQVNRIWQMLFGVGIVKSSENFGTQGERPSHSELLDWLAVSFQTGHYGPNLPKAKPWDIKALIRAMVTSNAYKQTSKVEPFVLRKDPENRYLSHSTRYRLPAEMIRDQALMVSNLIVNKLGGPSVKPYQPAGLWEDISFKGEFTAQYFVQDHGENLYRRSMYTFWKRTCPPPSLQTFDAPEREFCIVRRSTTNTPLQALALMNDITYVEASRKLAERVLTHSKGNVRDKIKYLFTTCTSRDATDQEVKSLMTVFNKQSTRFAADLDAAKKLLAVGESKYDDKIDTAQLAAMSIVCSIVLNMDEVITRG